MNNGDNIAVSDTFECLAHTYGEPDGKITCVLDLKKQHEIELELEIYDLTEDGSTGTVCKIEGINKRHLVRIVSTVEDWLESDLQSDVAITFDSVTGYIGKRDSNNQPDNFELYFGISDKGIEIGSERNNLRIPAGTEMYGPPMEYSDVYNIKHFKRVVERFIFWFGEDDQFRSGSEGFEIAASRLHKRLREEAVPQYRQGEYPAAARTAVTILEEEVATYAPEEYEDKRGSDLMKSCFGIDAPLSFGEEKAEDEGLMFLFAGVYQGVRNPLSHRIPDPAKGRYLDSLGKKEAHEIICMVDFLLERLSQNLE